MSPSDSPDKYCVTLGNGECVSENCMHTQPEPTLTCSEVVERLPQDLEDYRLAPSGEGPLAANWEDKPHRLVYDLVARCHAAETALRGRERRVQELEDGLGRIRKSLEMSQMSSTTKFIAQFIDEAEAEVERLLKSDEWREQIRKGAKHESDL